MFNLALIALEIILYMFESRLLGRQFFISPRSPFLGISLMDADLKLVVNHFFIDTN